MYQKSLLYFVANALGADLRMPILGLENVYNAGYSGWDGSPGSAETLANWRNAMELSKLGKRLSVHDGEKLLSRRGNGADLREQIESASHGGFDNNVEAIGRMLQRITGAPLELPVDELVGF